jgi:hypothetical protein
MTEQRDLFADGYATAELDVVTWLQTQVPVVLCQDLAVRILVGAHRGHALKPERSTWEIPIQLVEDTPECRMLVREHLAQCGAQLCVTDAGELVAVPHRPLTSTHVNLLAAAMRRAPWLQAVGTPKPFPVPR